MDVYIREVKDYTCIVIKFFFVFLCIFQNIHLISCRYLFNFKRKVKNKAHFKALIYRAYIVGEISTFISYYFEPQLRVRINHVSRHDNGGKASLCGNLSIFSHPRRLVPKNVVRGRYLSKIEFR
jgi:hypothetical protein